MRNEEPLVSIGIPTYNKAMYIGYTLDSVVNQTYPNIEIIVSDNASNDNTDDVVEKYVKKYGVKYYKNYQSVGGTEKNSNKCIELSSGEFIGIYHSDDVYMNNIVEKQVAVLKEDKDIGAVFTQAYHINKDGKITGERKLPDISVAKSNIKILETVEGFQQFLDYGCFPVCPTSMVRKSVYDEVGYFDSSRFTYAFDLDMWIKINLKYKIAVIAEPLIKYRIYTGQGTDVCVNDVIDEPEEYRTIDYYLSNDKIKERIRIFDLCKYKERRIKDRFKAAIRTFCKFPDASVELLKKLANIDKKYRNYHILFKLLKIKPICYLAQYIIRKFLNLWHELKY